MTQQEGWDAIYANGVQGDRYFDTYALRPCEASYYQRQHGWNMAGECSLCSDGSICCDELETRERERERERKQSKQRDL